MRAPGTNGVSFVMQGFIDEIAIAAGKDPLQFRLDTLASPSRAIPPRRASTRRARAACSKRCATCRTGTTASKLPKGTGKGVAFQFAHAGYVAYVVEVAGRRRQEGQRHQGVDGDRHRPPDRQPELESTNLVQGAFIEAMSHMMAWQITIDKGRVVQRNFNNYQPTRMSQIPPSIDVKFLQTDFDPTGLGEPALPPAIPAITNAIFAATGVRIRSVPLNAAGYGWV